MWARFLLIVFVQLASVVAPGWAAEPASVEGDWKGSSTCRRSIWATTFRVGPAYRDTRIGTVVLGPSDASPDLPVVEFEGKLLVEPATGRTVFTPTTWIKKARDVRPSGFEVRLSADGSRIELRPLLPGCNSVVLNRTQSSSPVTMARPGDDNRRAPLLPANKPGDAPSRLASPTARPAGPLNDAEMLQGTWRGQPSCVSGPHDIELLVSDKDGRGQLTITPEAPDRLSMTYAVRLETGSGSNMPLRMVPVDPSRRIAHWLPFELEMARPQDGRTLAALDDCRSFPLVRAAPGSPPPVRAIAPQLAQARAEAVQRFAGLWDGAVYGPSDPTTRITVAIGAENRSRVARDRLSLRPVRRPATRRLRCVRKRG